MLDSKDFQESKNLITKLIKDQKIVVPEPGRERFFINKSDESILVAKRLYSISQDKSETLKSYMWVIATAYYSMFFAATSLLASFRHKINVGVGIHKLTYHALVYYFHLQDNKLQKHFLETYKENYDNAEELLQISEAKAIEMLDNFRFEQAKRKDFTYEMGYLAEESKAITSINRAQMFTEEVKNIIALRNKST